MRIMMRKYLIKRKLSIGEGDIAAHNLIVEKILEEQAYEAAISDFSAMLSPGRVFVVKFDDLLTELGQRSVAGKLANWLEVWEKVTRLFSQADRANLDRKQVVISAFLMLEAAARG